MATRSWRLEWPVVRWVGWLGVLLATMVTTSISFRLGSGFGNFTGNVVFAVVIAPLILAFLVLLTMLARGDPPMCGFAYLMLGGLVLVFGAEAGAMGFGAAVAAPGFAILGAQPAQPRDWRAQGPVIVGVPVVGARGRLVAGRVKPWGPATTRVSRGPAGAAMGPTLDRPTDMAGCGAFPGGPQSAASACTERRRA
jgi:hypothetical protein